MEVLSPKPDFDFDFNTARSPPYSYLTAPPSPTGFSSSFFSAQTSPSRISDFYREFDQFSPFHDPPPPKGRGNHSPVKEDFAFDSPLVSQRTSLSADELFDGGKIRPLPSPTRAQIDEQRNHKTPSLSPNLPRLPISKGKMMISNVFWSNKKKYGHPFEIEVALERTSARTGENRGRDRVQDLSKNSSRRATRSSSPYRVPRNLWEEEEEAEEKHLQDKTPQAQASSSKDPEVSAPKSSSRKWRLRDFLLFRSSSEGRAADYKNPFRKHVGLFRKPEEVKGDNLRCNEEGAGLVRCRQISAHELHYTANRAAAEDSRKRTFLPYKQGILGG